MIADTNRNRRPGRILRWLGAIALGTALCALPEVPMADAPAEYARMLSVAEGT